MTNMLAYTLTWTDFITHISLTITEKKLKHKMGKYNNYKMYGNTNW